MTLEHDMGNADVTFTFDDGWFMASLGNLNIVAMEQLSDKTQSFERYLEAIAADIDAWPLDRPRSVLYHALDAGTLTPLQRRAIGEVLAARVEKLRRITRGYTFVTNSTAVRGFVMAIFWIAPPPYAYRIVGSPRAACEWLATQNEALDPKIALRQHTTCLRRFEGVKSGRTALPSVKDAPDLLASCPPASVPSRAIVVDLHSGAP